MSQSVYKKIKHRLEGWKKSERLLQMVNGVLVPSQAVWKGVMWLGGIEVEGSFEVFDSGGNWAFLLGKPLLCRFNAEQDFSSDTVIIRATPELTPINLCNEINQPALRDEIIGMNLTLDVKQGPNIQSILMRGTDPWKPEQVARILKEITIGWDITNTEQAKVQDTIAEFADCFALSIKEVNAILGAIHKLNIPEGVTFRTKILPRSYNPDQRVFMEVKIDEMLEAGIICSIHPKDICFVAQTVLVQKAHEGDGLTIEELKHQVNNQCTKHGLPSEFEMPP